MKALQFDVTSVVARQMVPVILQAFENGNNNDATISAALDSLREWNFTFRTNQIAPTIYHAFWNLLKEKIWTKLFQFGQNSSIMHPSRRILLTLIHEQPSSKWFDDPQTVAIENLYHRVRQIFSESTKKLQEEFGPDLNSWRYGRYHIVSAQHLLRLPDWGIGPLPRDGEDYTLNVASGRHVTHGPSMRMLVEMDDPIRAFAINFGGQSGHPGAPHYQDQIDEWLAGIYFPVRFASSPDQIPKEEIEEILMLKPQTK
jgi:penicillin amidase